MKYFLLLSLFLLLCVQPGYTQVGLFVRPDSSSLVHPVSGQTWLFNSSNNTMSVWNGSSFLVNSTPKNNFVATTNPTSANDNTQGYTPGSQWYNTVNTNVYSLVDATTAAAVWVQTNNLGGLTIPLTQLAAGGATTGQSIVFNGSHWAAGSQNVLLSSILQSGASAGQVPVWNGTNWVPTTASGTVVVSQVLFGDNTNYNPLPTSGTIAGGTYLTSGNWVQTGAITFSATAYCYFGGTVTFNNTVTVTAGGDWNKGGKTPGGNTSANFDGKGQGPSGGGGGNNTFCAGGGGGCGGAGGAGGFYAGSSATPGTNGGQAISLTGSPLMGSGGGIGFGLTGIPPVAFGGDGGAGLYIESIGNVVFTSAATVGLNGGAGIAGAVNSNYASGGGSGGVLDVRSLGSININSGANITANGGAGGAGHLTNNYNASGGGGGGGLINFMALGGTTNNGTVTVTGGVAGGGTGVGGVNGSNGTVSTNLNFMGRRYNL